LIVDVSDAADVVSLAGAVSIRAADTRIADSVAAIRFCRDVLGL
jgi:hypothetical protein